MRPRKNLAADVASDEMRVHVRVHVHVYVGGHVHAPVHVRVRVHVQSFASMETVKYGSENDNGEVPLDSCKATCADSWDSVPFPVGTLMAMDFRDDGLFAGRVTQVI